MPEPPDHPRPSPEALLNLHGGQRVGRLKVFLGPCPGVGKTYAMLQAAQQRRREGIDVVVGVVETHGRTETQALLDGLDIIPRQQIEYRGKLLEEMDLDAILARRPRLALVDELAHSNAPGARHPKRHLDVRELVAAGIDVYTTLNVQHLESLNDAVAQITGVRVRETLPDRVLDEANEVQLIDLPPAELIQRLREGKVYIPQQVRRAIENFFTPGNLNALRELALRRTAERVDDQMQTWMQAQAIPGPWPATERIMVCVSPSPLSMRLVRAAKRRADRRNAPWLAVYVETPAHFRLSDDDRDRVNRTLRLAEQLGGESVSIPGHHPAGDLLRYAQQRNATEIIIGKSYRSRWQEWRYGSIVNDLIRQSGNIDIYVITGDEQPPARQERPFVTVSPRRDWRSYAAAIAAVAVVGVAAKLLEHFLSLGSPTMVFLLGVVYCAVRFGLGPSLVASVLSSLVYNFFFIDPLHTFTIASPTEALAFGVYFLIAIITSNLAARVRAQAEAARRREDRTAALFALNRAVAGSLGIETVVQAIATQVQDVLKADAVVLTPRDPGLSVAARSDRRLTLTEGDVGAATWSFQHGEPSGWSTDTLPGVPWLFLPLRTAQSTVGVLGLRFPPSADLISIRRQRLLEGLTDQAAIAIERSRLIEERQQTRVLSETEKLRTALFSSISHDLRTPLASIIGSVSSLLRYGYEYDDATRKDLLLTIEEEAERLNRFVGNLLDITRLESGRLELNRQWVELEDIVGAAIARLERPLSRHHVRVEIGRELPLARVDFVLVEQVFVNLLENAAKFSPPGSAIQVNARVGGGQVQVEVIDEGTGVAPAELEHIFDKFYRVRIGDRQVAGTGLGLSICRGIIEAHGGAIRAEAGPGGRGLAIVVTLPVEPQPAQVAQENVSS